MTVPGMALFVECPACETRFEVFHATKDHRADCPTCHFRFQSDEYLCKQEKGAVDNDSPTPGVPPALVQKPRCLDGDPDGDPDGDSDGDSDGSPNGGRQTPPPVVRAAQRQSSGRGKKAGPTAAREAAPIEAPPIVETGIEIDDDSNLELKRGDSRPVARQDSAAAGDTQVDLGYLADDDSYGDMESGSSGQAEPFPDEEPIVVSEFSSPYGIAVAVLLSVISFASVCGIALLFTTRSSDAGSDLNKPKPGMLASDSESDAAAALSTDNSDEATIKSESADETKTATSPAAEIPPSRFTTTTNKDYDRIWRMNCEFLLRMGSTEKTSDQVANGVVIDRRGWVLTSIDRLDRHKTAHFASVFAPAWNQRLEEKKLGPPTSLIRGDAGLDLCVVHVPQAAVDIVEGISGTETGTAEVVVNAEFDFAPNTMMYAMTPEPETAAAPIVKCRLLEKREHAKVAEPTRAAMKQAGLEPQDRTLWLIHDGMLDPADTPCPIFSKTGELIAVHIYRDEKTKTGYAIRADVVTSMRSGLTGDLEWERSPRLTRLQERFGVGVSVDGDPTRVVEDDQPGFKRGDFAMLTAAKSQFTVCDERLDWMPKTMAEYQEVQKFVDLLLLADDTRSDAEIDAGRRAMFELEADSYYERISVVPWPTETQMIEQNQLAIEGLKVSGQPFFGYVRIEKVAAMSRELAGTPTVLCSILGTDQKVILPLNDGHGELRKNSKWLVMGRNDAKDASPEYLVEKHYAIVHAKRLIGH